MIFSCQVRRFNSYKLGVDFIFYLVCFYRLHGFKDLALLEFLADPMDLQLNAFLFTVIYI